MATRRRRSGHRQDLDCSHSEQLPDPPRHPDLRRTEVTDAFRSLLGLHFAERDDVLVSGGGCLRRDPGNDSEQLAPDSTVWWAFGVDPAAIVARNGYVIGEVAGSWSCSRSVAGRSDRGPQA